MGYSRPTLTLGTASAIGTGNATVSDVTGYASFSAVPDGSTLHYIIQDSTPDANFEWGLTTKTGGVTPVLSRSAGNVLGGTSGAGVLVNFSSGTQNIYAGPIGEVEVVPNVSSDPSVSSLGQIIYHTSPQRLRAYVGSSPAWQYVLTTADNTIAYTDVLNVFSQVQIFDTEDAGTSNVAQLLIFRHNSGNTPTAGFGAYQLFELKSSTTNNRFALEWDWLWADATDATRKARLVGYVYDTSAREFLRAESDGSNALLGIGGAVVSGVRQTIYAGSDTNVPLAVEANSTSTTGDLFQILDSGGTKRLYVKAASTWASKSVQLILDNTVSNNDLTRPPLAFSDHTDTGFVCQSTNGDFKIVANGVDMLSSSQGSSAVNIGQGASFPALLLKGTFALQSDAGNATVLTVGTAYTSQLKFGTGNFMVFDITNARLSIGKPSYTPSSTLDIRLQDATTNVTSTVFQVRHHSTGTPAASFGSSQLFQLDSSTTTDRSAAEIDVLWVTATDASRKARMTLNVYDTAIREAIRMEANGTEARCAVNTPAATLAQFGGVIFDHYADAGNTTTTETDLYSDTTQASLLNANGDKITAVYGGTFVNSTSTKQLKLYFGGTVIFDSGALTISAASDWVVNAVITRDTSTSVRCTVWANLTGASTGTFANYIRVTSLTLSNTNILKITGTAAGVGAATNDIVASQGTVSWIPTS